LPVAIRRLRNAVEAEGARVCGMLEHATPAAHGGESGGKATVIVVDLVAPARVIDRREQVPAMAWRMRYHPVGAGIGARVSRLVPRINVRQAKVGAASFDKEGGDLFVGR